MSDRILIVDDERDFARGLARLVSSEFPDAETDAVFSGEEALAELGRGGVRAMLTDLRMPAMNGLSLLKRALRDHPSLSAVVLTAHGTIETAVEALKLGATDFLTKPVEPQQLFRAVRLALERSRLMAENERLRGLVEGTEGKLLGESPAMESLRSAIAAVAQSDYTVLVQGESGSGKEMAARLVHDLSPRAEKPFRSVNCPAIPEHLQESELFGHVKGAFTGADRDRRGMIAAAAGGTLHLDEIGDISPTMQTKLLRFLEEREVRPVGSSETIRVDTRVVASTNQDLAALVADRSFREDLYYRLNVLTLRVPPLRERKEDVPLLAGAFLSRACRELGSGEKVLSPDAVGELSRRDWPGNVRELQNFMRRLAVFSPGEEVDVTAVRLADGGHAPGVPDGTSAAPLPFKDAKARLVDEFTQGYMRELMERTKGNVSQAARESGLSRVALQNTLARIGLDPERFRG
ncbi:sigma-54-dependent transcriptional regulator [Desulfohalovibrio reitneri]|uniref:sigma-54-dependent transcriptional regulator n=1 Tax=Desulfohalovibrio reitneri TaxID=1307759 RepID=UPI0004A712B8|nr:sigma-54 dependent transcriptional regulator [Desulfohalovibrio reitneri]